MGRDRGELARPIVLRPLGVARTANLAPGVILLVLAVVGYGVSGPGDILLAGGTSALTAAVGVFLCVRMWRYSITLEADRMVVRGILWSRTIFRSSITSVGIFGWVSWTDRHGRARAWAQASRG